MRLQKSAYELSASQVKTPPAVVSLFWSLMRKARPGFDRVFDMGAGDARFALGGHYRHYEGIEIDPKASSGAVLPKNAVIKNGCAFQHSQSEFDACIGNPPYVRHHDIESPWKQTTADRINRELGIQLDLHGNLYLYFLCLGLIKAKENGLVGLLIPYEWVSRPSAQAIRKLIQQKKWGVSVYRFQQPIFPGVLTTASISIIDKSSHDGAWSFYNILSNLDIITRRGVSGSGRSILDHTMRGNVWARRGLSPGAQKVFTLTEGERIHAGLSKRDVMPCVTTLRHLPPSVKELTERAFRKHFVESGHRCWLVRCNGQSLSSNVSAYLDGVPKKLRQSYTCLNQDPWYSYEHAPIPDLLFHSGFTEFGPKVLVNSIGAQAVGSIYGIHSEYILPLHKLRTHLGTFNFERRVVAHAKSLKKVEVRQLNSVLSAWWKKWTMG